MNATHQAQANVHHYLTQQIEAMNEHAAFLDKVIAAARSEERGFVTCYESGRTEALVLSAAYLSMRRTLFGS